MSAFAIIDPRPILTYGEKYIAERGLESAKARVLHLNKRIAAETALGDLALARSMIDEAENLRKAILDAGGQPPIL